MTAPPTTRLLLARHGQSTWNAEQRWQGQADPPLSDHGRQQAFAAAAGVGDVDLIAASPQQRALETATIISDQIGVGPVVVVDDVRERSAGEWSGLTRIEIEERYEGWLEREQWPKGWEYDDTLVVRVDTALRAIVADYAGGTILVVCHGGVIRSFEQHLGIAEGRVPNLSGRLLSMEHAVGHGPGEGHWRAGEQVRLIDTDIATGGDGQRV